MAILCCYTFGADEVPAVGTPPAPRLCGRPRRVPVSRPACACRSSTSRTVPRGDGRAPQSPARRSPGARDAAARPSKALSTRTWRTRCSGRWRWSLASTERMSCRSSGSITTHSTPRRPCCPATESGARLGCGGFYLTPPVSSVPAAPGTGRCRRRERSDPGQMWEGAGGGAGAALPAPKRASVAVGPAG